MGNNKSRDVIMAIAGGYLAYTGVNLIMNALSEKEGNYIIFVLFGAFFVIFGGVVLFLRLKQLLHFPTSVEEQADQVEENADEDQIEAVEVNTDEVVVENDAQQDDLEKDNSEEEKE